MKKILIGLLFVFISVTIGGINYTPAWLGYGLIFWGLAGSGESAWRGSAMTVALAAAVLSAAEWAAGLFGYGMAFPLGLILRLLMSYRLLIWCEELDELDGGYLMGRFRMSWYALAGASVAAYALGLVVPPLGWAWSVAAFLAAMFYTYTYYRLVRIAPPQLQG